MKNEEYLKEFKRLVEYKISETHNNSSNFLPPLVEEEDEDAEEVAEIKEILRALREEEEGEKKEEKTTTSTAAKTERVRVGGAPDAVAGADQKKRMGDLASIVAKKTKTKDLTQVRADESMKLATVVTGRQIYTPMKRKKIFSGATRKTEITEVTSKSQYRGYKFDFISLCYKLL